MADEKEKGKEIIQSEDIQRIRYLFLLNLLRMTLRSREVKPLEAACAEIVARAKN